LRKSIRLASLRGTARNTCSRLRTIRLLWILLCRIGLFRSRTTSGSRPKLAVGRKSFRYVYSGTLVDVISWYLGILDKLDSRHFARLLRPVHTIVRSVSMGLYVGPILISSPRTRSDNLVTNSILKTHEKKRSGSELEFTANATQSSRRDDMLTHLIAPSEITRSADILS
jgi:hypothetical protein